MSPEDCSTPMKPGEAGTLVVTVVVVELVLVTVVEAVENAVMVLVNVDVDVVEKTPVIPGRRDDEDDIRESSPGSAGSWDRRFHRLIRKLG